MENIFMLLFYLLLVMTKQLTFIITFNMSRYTVNGAPWAIGTDVSDCKSSAEVMHKAGLDFAVKQVNDLLKNGVQGVHIYTMNNAKVAGDIYCRIRNVIEKELR